jgi:O-antigen/teichoic acid export membrane protein
VVQGLESAMSLTNALKWSFLSELASKAIQPVVFIVLARLLTPEDFGVMTAALMVIAFSQIFWEAGMGKALIQRKVKIEDATNVAFWVNICLGLVVSIMLFISAAQIAHTFFHDERVTAVIQVMTLQILISAMSSVHNALLQKQMGFKKLFWVRFSTVSLPGIVSIPLALNGMGYWALVSGTLVGQLIQLVMLWRMSQWRPSWTFNSIVAKEMSRFGAWAGASGLLVWFFLWADSLIVGMYLGSNELGMYRYGNLIVASIFGIFASALMPVAYSYFSEAQADINALKSKLFFMERVFALLMMPLAAIIILTSDFATAAIFKDKWHGLGLVVSLTAISQVLAYTVSLKQEVYRSIGKPDIETKIMFISMVIRIPIYLITIQYGLFAFLIGRIISTQLGVINHLVFAKLILKLKFCDYLNAIKTPVVGSALAAIIGAFVAERQLSADVTLSMTYGLMTTLLIYIIILVFLERPLMKIIAQSIKLES